MRVTGREVRVDVGARRARANSLTRATVLTPAGAVPATFVRLERICEELCSELADEECHYEALLRTSRPAPDAIAALAGRRSAGAIAVVKPGPDRPTGSADDWIDAEPVQWGTETFRWARFADGVYLQSVEHGRDFYAPAIDLASCTTRVVAPLTMMVCPSAQMLYEGKRGVALSFADYGEATVEPLLRLQLDGRDALLIRFGLKAEVTVALVIKEAGQWRVRFRAADYALIC